MLSFTIPKETANLLFSWEKSPKMSTLILTLDLEISQCGNWFIINYVYLPVLCWRIYHIVRDFNFTMRKSLTVPLPVLVNDKYSTEL
jgi:hypothetical protein